MKEKLDRLGERWHWFGTVLIKIGNSAGAVLVWSAATHNRPRPVTPSSNRYHRIIDI